MPLKKLMHTQHLASYRTSILIEPGKLLVLLLMVLILGACSSSPPRNPNNSCDIFEQKGGWYKDARKSYKKWGVPIHVQLAIIYQESRFKNNAKPPRTKLLWIIPWKRPSSAYGYGQVLDGTWNRYRKATGHHWADRDDFDDIVDFIGWYGATSARTLGISKKDSYKQYLAYHEGQIGYKKKSYRNKPWLLKIARRVEQRANNYQAQLSQCEDELDKGWFFGLF